MWPRMLRASLLCLIPVVGGCGTGGTSGGGSPWSGAVRQSALLEAPGVVGPQLERVFEGEAPLRVTLEADFSMLEDDREQEVEERPGSLILHGPGGDERIPVKVKTRGNFRLRDYICPFPPLRLNFPTDSLEGSVLESQDKLKLVTHCRDRDDYEQNILEEYLAYRIYNLITDVSFRVQLAMITYQDTSGDDDPTSRLGFLIEDDEAMAARLGGELLEVAAANPTDYVQHQAGLMYLFEFLIGNVDWSSVRFHNVKLVRIGTDYLPVPYDFDFSGFVDTPYAGPPVHLAERIKTVTERLYRGWCSDSLDYGALFSHFQERREAILALIQNQPALSDRGKRTATAFVEEFYDILNDEKDADWKIIRSCRRPDARDR